MAAGFVDFVRAVHGHDPFPWQVRAAEALCAGEIPEAICVPTGTGKTSILDAAIFAMSKGKLVRRVAYTVDRRLVVDGVSDHAQRLAAAWRGVITRRSGRSPTVWAARFALSVCEAACPWMTNGRCILKPRASW